VLGADQRELTPDTNARHSRASKARCRHLVTSAAAGAGDIPEISVEELKHELDRGTAVLLLDGALPGGPLLVLAAWTAAAALAAARWFRWS
jgi:hypothetical protein